MNWKKPQNECQKHRNRSFVSMKLGSFLLLLLAAAAVHFLYLPTCPIATMLSICLSLWFWHWPKHSKNGFKHAVIPGCAVWYLEFRMKIRNRTPASISKSKRREWAIESWPSFGITEQSVAVERRKSRTNQNAIARTKNITNMNESIESIKSNGLTVTMKRLSILLYIDEIEKKWLGASGQAKIKHRFEMNKNITHL